MIKHQLWLATKNKPGAIADLVEPFAKNKVSMTKLESRQQKLECGSMSSLLISRT